MSEAQTNPATTTRIGPAIASVAALALVFAIDWLTPADIPCGPLYLLPIAIAAWYLGGAPTAAMVGAATLARTLALARDFAGESFAIHSVEFAITLAVHVLAGMGLLRLRRLLARLASDANAASTQALESERQAREAERRMAIQWSIRRAVPSDVDAIVGLVVIGAQTGDLGKEALDPARQQALRATYLHGMETGSVHRRTWGGQDAVVPMELWVSHLNGTVGGYFMVLGLDANGGSERELHAIVTAESCRSVGLGSAMVDFFCAHYHGRRQFAACMSGGRMHGMLTHRGFRKVADTKEGYVILGRPDWLRHGAQEAGAKLGFVPVSDSILQRA